MRIGMILSVVGTRYPHLSVIDTEAYAPAFLKDGYGGREVGIARDAPHEFLIFQ